MTALNWVNPRKAFTTPPPTYQPEPPPLRLADQPDRMGKPEQVRVRAAALRATRVLPGPIGRLVQRELTAYAEFGFRLDRDSLMSQVVEHVHTTPLTP